MIYQMRLFQLPLHLLCGLVMILWISSCSTTLPVTKSDAVENIADKTQEIKKTPEPVE